MTRIAVGTGEQRAGHGYLVPECLERLERFATPRRPRQENRGNRANGHARDQVGSEINIFIEGARRPKFVCAERAASLQDQRRARRMRHVNLRGGDQRAAIRRWRAAPIGRRPTALAAILLTLGGWTSVRRRGYGQTPAEINRCDDAISFPGAARAAWVVQACGVERRVATSIANGADSIFGAVRATVGEYQ
jgi:hypothetical protein